MTTANAQPTDDDRAATTTANNKAITTEKPTIDEAYFDEWEQRTMGPAWLEHLSKELQRPYYKSLKRFVTTQFLARRQPIYPEPDNVFAWSRYCPTPERVRVVIIGQDPYHSPHQAHGLSFSVPHGVAAPPSLINIYKELEGDIPGFQRPTHGCLVKWAEQGVLLLNTVLTVEHKRPGSHRRKGWEQFTDAVLKVVLASLKDSSALVFILWGLDAQKKAKAVLDRQSAAVKRRVLVLTSAHPSPLSAYRGFLGSRCFSKTNEFLAKHGHEPIDWACL